MAKPKQCSHCTKTATIHLTQIVDNQINKVDICEECPLKKGLTDPEGFSLSHLFPNADTAQDVFTPKEFEKSMGSQLCDATYEDFKKTGRLGAPDCYELFKDQLEPILKGMHRDLEHKGKVPLRMRGRIEQQRELRKLENQLNQAIAEERFEDAARIRDEIKAFEGAEA